MAIDIGKIRNVGVVGHGGVGKTSLVEAHAVRRRRGDPPGPGGRRHRPPPTSTPTRSSGRSRSTRRSPTATGRATAINLVDTPGYGDFIADARAGLRVVEAAIVVVDAVAGVQVQTEKVWKFATRVRPAARHRGQPPRPRARRLLPHASSRSAGGSRGASCRCTSRSARRRASSGFVDLVKMKAIAFADGKADARATFPAELADRAKEYREKLVEAAAETDDDLLSQVPGGGLARRGRDAQGAPGRHRRGQDRAGPVRGRHQGRSASTRCST